MNKMVINHIDKLFVTNDAATIMREIEIQHPAAKLLILASEMQEKEVGDGTNFTIIFASALLQNAAELLNMVYFDFLGFFKVNFYFFFLFKGLSPIEIIDGYNIALKRAVEILPSIEFSTQTSISYF